MQSRAIAVFWFRRDLRIDDNSGLYHALSSGLPVLPVFIFDTNILDKLKKDDPRVSFIHQQVAFLKHQLEQKGSSLMVYHGDPVEFFRQIVSKYTIVSVFTNRDYEPYATERDEAINQFLHSRGVLFHSFKDQVVFDQNEVVKNDGSPYTVFTPYSTRWKMCLSENDYIVFPSEDRLDKLLQVPPFTEISLETMGFTRSVLPITNYDISENKLRSYGTLRDYPARDGTSHLGVHLRFGTVSIRKVVREALKYSEKFLNELIWRDFYAQILWHFPYAANGSFKPAYDRIEWRNDELELERWCLGETGYPLVDAGMRELNQTGYMHNRVRMVTASFLAKHLLIDWRWGEAYFAEKLLDFDLASNNGGWQWAAGSGCDAAPYFRVFNPALQAQKFDPTGEYIRKWVPEYQTTRYPKPMFDHPMARLRAIKAYRTALNFTGK